MCNGGRRIGGDAQHGRPLVGRAYSGITQSNGLAHRSGQDLDGTPCLFGTTVCAESTDIVSGEGGEWLTMSETAKALGVTNHMIRRLITAGVLPAVQVVPATVRLTRSAPRT